MNECGYWLCTWPEFLVSYGTWAVVVALLAWAGWKASQSEAGVKP